MIIETLTSEYTFWEWQQKSDNYKNQFSLEGAKALFNYFDELSDDLGEPMEFDPIAWLCDFTEYDSLADAWEQLGGGTAFVEGEELAVDDNIELWLENNTTVIKLDNGGVLVQNF